MGLIQILVSLTIFAENDGKRWSFNYFFVILPHQNPTTMDDKKQQTRNLIMVDTVDVYNKIFGLATQHPLVSVVDLSKATRSLTKARIHYGVYAVFLKHSEGCAMHYGRQKYDYQDGTVVCFAPGQVVDVDFSEDDPAPEALGVLFHPDLIYGTPLAEGISQYTYFDYNEREALHLSDAEQSIVKGVLAQISMELQHPIDKHSKPLIVDAIRMLLDYCMRYYERQFITRERVNSDILARFERHLSDYFASGHPERNGLPSVAYFADKAYLSPSYFGDLIKRETGQTAQRYIQSKVIGLSKHYILDDTLTLSEIAYRLGFQYPQHFTRLFKQQVGMTPSEYRVAAGAA